MPQAVLHCFLPLTLGGLLYLLFRSNELKMFLWLEMLGVKPAITSIRTASSQFNELMPNWAYFSLPDGLWVYAFTAALILYLREQAKQWLVLPLLFGPIIEIFQFFNVFPGTFDFVDLLFTLCAYICSILFLRKNLSDEK
jgi:hypothetical protein